MEKHHPRSLTNQPPHLNAHTSTDTFTLLETDPMGTLPSSSLIKNDKKTYEPKQKGQRQKKKQATYTSKWKHRNSQYIEHGQIKNDASTSIPTITTNSIISTNSLTTTFSSIREAASHLHTYRIVCLWEEPTKHVNSHIQKHGDWEREGAIYNTNTLKVPDYLLRFRLHLKAYKEIQRDFPHGVGKLNVRVMKKLLADFAEEIYLKAASHECQELQDV